MNRIVLILYTLLLIFFTLFSYFSIDRNLFYLRNIYTGLAFDKRFSTTIIYILLIFLFFIFDFLFLILLKKKRIGFKNIKLLISITVVILFFSYPAMLSYDIFNYLTTAKVLFFYKENPYIVMPIEFVGEPFLSFTRAANKTALYGPAWILLTGIPYLASFGNFILLLFAFKFVIILFYIATVFLIWKFTKDVFSTAFFALNPLVIIETIGSGHNDIVMIFFALLSFYLLMHKRIWLGFLFLLISIFVKYATIFLVPVFIYIAWQSKKDKVNWGKIFTISALIMFAVFLILSPLREEIYPWYAIWFLIFVALIPSKKFILYTSIIFSFSLLLRYVPYMLSGSYLGSSIIKILISFMPSILFSMYYGFKKKI